MALIITQQGTTLFLEGTLNETTIKPFKTHFDFIQNPFKSLTVNLDKVIEMDASALQALKEMYKNEALNHNPFFVAGFRSEEIYEDYQFLNIA